MTVFSATVTVPDTHHISADLSTTKAWGKIVTGFDGLKKGGFAIEGAFLRPQVINNNDGRSVGILLDLQGPDVENAVIMIGCRGLQISKPTATFTPDPRTQSIFSGFTSNIDIISGFDSFAVVRVGRNCLTGKMARADFGSAVIELDDGKTALITASSPGEAIFTYWKDALSSAQMPIGLVNVMEYVQANLKIDPRDAMRNPYYQAGAWIGFMLDSGNISQNKTSSVRTAPAQVDHQPRTDNTPSLREKLQAKIVDRVTARVNESMTVINAPVGYKFAQFESGVVWLVNSRGEVVPLSGVAGQTQLPENFHQFMLEQAKRMEDLAWTYRVVATPTDDEEEE